MSAYRNLQNADDVEAQRGVPTNSEQKNDGDVGYDAGDEAMVVNFFDYLASSAVSQADDINKLNAASLGSKKAPSRRRSRQVRMKQYLGDGGQAIDDTKEDKSVSGPAHMEAQQPVRSEISLDMNDKGSNKLRRAPSPPPVHEESPHNNCPSTENNNIGANVRNKPKQRHTIEIVPPAAMVSSGSDDSDEDVGENIEDVAGSFPAASPRAMSRGDSSSCSSSGSSSSHSDSCAKREQNINDYHETYGVLNDLETEHGNQTYAALQSDSESSGSGGEKPNQKQSLGDADLHFDSSNHGVNSSHDMSHGAVSYEIASSDDDAIYPSEPYSQFAPSIIPSLPPMEKSIQHETQIGVAESTQPSKTLQETPTISQFEHASVSVKEIPTVQKTQSQSMVPIQELEGPPIPLRNGTPVEKTQSAALRSTPSATPSIKTQTTHPPTIETIASTPLPMKENIGGNFEESKVPLQQSADAKADMMASLASKAASKRRAQQINEDQIITERPQTVSNAEPSGNTATDLSEDPLEASKRRHEDIQRRRQQALAIAAAACHRREDLTHTELPEKKTISEDVQPHRLVELKSVSSAEGNFASPSPSKDSVDFYSSKATDDLRHSRRLELEKRKRDLEAVARKSSYRPQHRVSFSPASHQPPHQAKKILCSLSEHHPTIDVYTGEEIGEMPNMENVRSKRISRTSKEINRQSDFDDDSSSEFTTTVYDLPVRKTGTTTGNIILVLLLIGMGLGVYFGLFFDRKSDQGDTTNLSPQSIDGGSSPFPPPQSPPQLAPTQIPTVDAASFRSRPAVSLPESVDPTLFVFLSAQWPMLIESIFDEGSAQLQALEWLSNEADLASYSDKRKKQRFSLATFFFSTNGSNWTRSDHWLTGLDECSWYTSSSTREPCDSNGSFVNLELEMNGLSGSLPEELGLLSSTLTRIDLTIFEGGAIGGSIPTEIGLIRALELLDLQGNSIHGRLPTEIGNLHSLTSLNIRDNELSGKLPDAIGLLSSLIELDVYGNSLDGPLPSKIGGLYSLQTLCLEANNFTGDIPSEIGTLVSLEDLSANNNAFTRIPTNIGSLVGLKSISMANNVLEGEIPFEMGNLTYLSNLDLSKNVLSGTIPSALGNLPFMEYLDLSDNQLPGPIPAEFGRLLFLRRLSLHSNFLTGGVPRSLDSLGLLDDLRLEKNSLMGMVPESVCAVFRKSLPNFVADCVSEIQCACCSFCCADAGKCECQFADDESLSFLCARNE